MDFLIKEAAAILEANKYHEMKGNCLFSGLEGSLKHLIMAALSAGSSGPLLVITADNTGAEKIAADLKAVIPQGVTLFPGENPLLIPGLFSQSREIANDRAKVLRELVVNKQNIYVTTIAALLPRLLPPDVWRDGVFTLKVEDEVSPLDLISRFIDLGYRRTALVEEKGQVSLKGGVLDFYPTGMEVPVRIEFFGDNIESLRYFEPESQRSIKSVKEVAVYPAGEYFLPQGSTDMVGHKIRTEAEVMAGQLGKEGKEEAAHKVRQRAAEITARLDAENIFSGAEHFLCYYYGKGASFLDYLPQDSTLILDEPLRLEEAWQKLSQQLNDMKASLLLAGEILPTQAEYFWEFPAMVAAYPGKIAAFSLFSRKTSYLEPRSEIKVKAALPPHYQEQWHILAGEVREWKSQGYRIVLAFSREQGALSLKKIFDEENIDSLLLRHKDGPLAPPPGVSLIVSTHPDNGFILPQAKLVYLTEGELLARPRKIRKRPKGKESLRLADYRELKVGDYIVHEQHGIGSYQGIVPLKIGGVKKDYLYIKYSGTDKLYITTEQIDTIQKYVGVEGKTPKLSTLGGQEWSRVKTRVRESVEELARELLALYSEREALKGYKFSPDQAWQREFEERFPYPETPDQLRAIEEVKKDMENERPMDRLICGDVGYGKTEVALRAAFKAILDGKQAAFLVPTTILAQQHYRNFLERFAGFPISVDLLSRFRTSAVQKETIRNIKLGKVDLVVGTHRLLSKDIHFKDLGLLVVDEEQRFGVKHKERLKMLKKNVDVLTLTATPIPRTLHMSLAGARDLSVIETAPEDRYPIQTYVTEYSDYLLKEAVQREVRRSGQVYFVFNRVQNIEKWVSHLKKLLPGIRIGLGHGQMPEKRLEKVMLDFLEGNYDLLISTTIVEAGLDLPNVNTMIIYDADKLGLAQLYQLRGRVGRSDRVAYCYLTYQKDKVLSEIAEKRLQAIREFTELGSGLKIALRDLEIRGAGNILGPEQHGFVAAVGFDLYCRLLENAVSALKGTGLPEAKPEVRVEININAYLPSEYVPEQAQKIAFYQKIAAAAGISDLEDIKTEIRDRYGPLPQAVENLFLAAVLKVAALESGVESLREENEIIKIIFSPELRFDSEKLLKLVRAKDGRLKIVMGRGISLKVSRRGFTEKELLEFLLELLGDIKNLA